MGYTAKSLKLDQPYYAAWQEYRRRRRICWLVFLGFPFSVIPIGILAGFLGQAFDTNASVLALVFAFMALLTVMAVGVWSGDFRCPRCGKSYFWRPSQLEYNSFSQHCLHCRLPKYAPCDPGEQQWEYIRLYEHPKPSLWQRLRGLVNARSRDDNDAGHE